MKSARVETAPVPAQEDQPTAASTWVTLCVGIGLLGTAWFVDPFAAAAFDAPKRLVTMIAAVAGGAALALSLPMPRPRRWSRPAKVVLLLMLIVGFGCVVATLLSPVPLPARSALRTLALFALFLPLGAAFAPDRGGRRIVAIAAIAVAVNAALSLLQAGGGALPIPLALPGGRFPTGALLGNEGYVALAAALAATAALAVLLQRGARYRPAAAALLLLCVAAIAVNRQLTATIAFIAAALAMIAVQGRRPRLVWLGAGLIGIAAITALQPALRDATWARLPLGGVEGVQQRSTYRLGAWAAAVAMIDSRPLTGFGPGSYALQSQRHRLDAEIALRARLLPPPTANAFVFAHQDYLQLAAEAGVPALAAALAALGLLIAGLLRRLAAMPDDVEARLLLGVITAGAVSALAWFPMQIPFTAMVLLLACGRAWRLLADEAAGTS
jgi:O-antigen ligase